MHPTKAHVLPHERRCTFAHRIQILINMQQENITFNDMPQMLAVMYAKLNELGDKVDN